jgi:hypothetical protein
MDPRTAPVVGLKGPFALGHGCHSSLRLAITSGAQVCTRSPLVSSVVSLTNRRGLRVDPDRSRVATFGRLFEGTDEISLGQTSADGLGNVDISHSSHRPGVAKNYPQGNVAERLALRQKTVSFWQCCSHTGTAPDNEARTPDRSRAHRLLDHCDEPRPRGVPAGRQQSDDDCPSPQAVDNYVDSSFAFSWWSHGPA